MDDEEYHIKLAQLLVAFSRELAHESQEAEVHRESDIEEAS